MRDGTRVCNTAISRATEESKKKNVKKRVLGFASHVVFIMILKPSMMFCNEKKVKK